MAKTLVNYNKYENYIRVGSSANNLQNFPTPATLHRTLHDVDKDAFTDLQGYTHRNRVRHDVEDIEVSFPVLSVQDRATILNMISPTWIYVELVDAKTQQKKVVKMYASDKEWDTFIIFKDANNNWQTEDVDLTFTLIQE